MKAMGHAYVGFARAHPGLFSLMFRCELLASSRPALRDAIADARGAFARRRTRSCAHEVAHAIAARRPRDRAVVTEPVQPAVGWEEA